MCSWLYMNTQMFQAILILTLQVPRTCCRVPEWEERAVAAHCPCHRELPYWFRYASTQYNTNNMLAYTSLQRWPGFHTVYWPTGVPTVQAIPIYCNTYILHCFIDLHWPYCVCTWILISECLLYMLFSAFKTCRQCILNCLWVYHNTMRLSPCAHALSLLSVVAKCIVSTIVTYLHNM